MTTFYRGPYARITHKVFEVYRQDGRLFVIRDLKRVFVVPGGTGHQGAVRICSGGISGAAAVIVALGRTVNVWPVIVLAAVALFASGVALGASTSTRARPHQLWGSYRGRLTCLFESTDERTFGQVRRALLRALQSRDDTPSVPHDDPSRR
jgi:hypothetical protein